MISGLLWVAPSDTFFLEHLVLLARATTWTGQLWFPEALNICPNCGTKPVCPKLTSLLIYKHTNRWRGEIILVFLKRLIIILSISSAAGLHFWGDLESFSKGSLNKHHITTLDAAWIQQAWKKKNSLCPSHSEMIHMCNMNTSSRTLVLWCLFPVSSFNEQPRFPCVLWTLSAPKWFLGSCQ